MEGSQLTSSTGDAFSVSDKLATASGDRDAMPVCDCGYSEPSVI
jgi:hypothetical protein